MSVWTLGETAAAAADAAARAGAGVAGVAASVAARPAGLSATGTVYLVHTSTLADASGTGTARTAGRGSASDGDGDGDGDGDDGLFSGPSATGLVLVPVSLHGVDYVEPWAVQGARGVVPRAVSAGAMPGAAAAPLRLPPPADSLAAAAGGLGGVEGAATCAAVNPHWPEVIAAGFAGGALALFRRGQAAPLRVWPCAAADPSAAVVALAWLPLRPASLLAWFADGSLAVWDWATGAAAPKLLVETNSDPAGAEGEDALSAAAGAAFPSARVRPTGLFALGMGTGAGAPQWLVMGAAVPLDGDGVPQLSNKCTVEAYLLHDRFAIERKNELPQLKKVAKGF
jgi:hypothetical protein